MTIEGALWGFAIPYVIIAAATALLMHVVGPKWVLSLFESEGEASLRKLLAAVVVVFALFMVAADRLTDNKLEALLIFAGTLLGLGTGLKLGSRFAARPAAPATSINADKAEVTTETTNINTKPVKPPVE